MAYAIWSDVEQAATERWTEPSAPDTESLLAEVETESPIMYAIPALAAVEDAESGHSRFALGRAGAGDGHAGPDDGQADPAERQFLDGLILAGLVYP